MDEAVNRQEAAVLGEPGTARALLDGAAESIVGIDRKGSIVLVNRRMEASFGYCRSELLGKRFDLLLAERLRAEHVRRWNACFTRLDRRAPQDIYETVAVRKDGTEFPIEIRVSVVETRHRPVAMALLTDISSWRQMEAELREKRQELRALAGQLMHVGEEMRKQLARDLHDVLGQKLALLNMEVDGLRRDVGRREPEVRERLETMAAQIGQMAGDVHRISRQLHPAALSDLGLPAALESECVIFSRIHGVRATCHYGRLPRIPEDVALALYRIAQEAIRNAATHSGGDHVDVFLDSDDGTVHLRVEDHGRGFDPEALRETGGLGLVSMRERARLVEGIARIESHPGQGTVVEVRVPVRKEGHEESA